MLVDLNGAGRKSCPLCPEEKFKACYSHKLRRHLQNLHWKVYVEFEGQRMCICHLPCRNLKPSLSGDQASGRHVAHYHCVVCSVTIARKTDMISHLKRHVNKGETEASYSGSSDVTFEEPAPSGQAYEIMKELGTNVQLLPNHTTPQKSDTYFNRKMKTNRQLVFCSLAVLAEERNPLECLDAFGATGMYWGLPVGEAPSYAVTTITMQAAGHTRCVEDDSREELRAKAADHHAGRATGLESPRADAGDRRPSLVVSVSPSGT
ncbi:TRMT1-like protein [Morone saxatilis]|uniref:TRMT1-like protein n=1 Tax=Morone saxatilis TaxID=34816 RepID=UPI0015E2320C|nr:TRMT1-like protein [Morone saxatilis]